MLNWLAFQWENWSLFVHFAFFAGRHRWKGESCDICGHRRNRIYMCDTENRLRKKCEPCGDYPNCIEVVEAMLFVHFPEKDIPPLCKWCEGEAMRGFPVVY